jgi:hypothetical protein
MPLKKRFGILWGKAKPFANGQALLNQKPASGYGVTSLVEKIVQSEFLLLGYRADRQEDGSRER